MNLFRRINLFVIVLIIALSAKESFARDIYVRLSTAKKFSIGITDGNLIMTDPEGRISNLGGSANISVSGQNVIIGGYSFPMPVRITGTGFLKFNGKNYRGAFLITQRAGLLNVLDIEQYLYGVLPAEVGANWHMEALRTQAICARTYALKQSMNRADKGYDVVDTDSDQVYKGAGVETAKTNQAVNSTAGLVLTYGNELAATYFHSDSGGHTANVADVWGQNDKPYLCGVPEVVNYKSPVSVWNARFSAEKIQAAVTKATGTNIGKITEIQVSDVDEGGRAIMMTFIGSRGSKTIRAAQFRLALDPRTLKSTMLTPSGGSFNVTNTTTPSGLVTTQRNNQSSSNLNFDQEQAIAKMTAEGVFTTTELIDMLSNPSKQKDYYEIGLGRTSRNKPANKPANNPPQRMNKYGYSIEKRGNEFIFYGRGWGHGVGLCQWGSMAMAEQGYKGEQILAHYYPGTSVRRIK